MAPTKTTKPVEELLNMVLEARDKAVDVLVKAKEMDRPYGVVALLKAVKGVDVSLKGLGQVNPGRAAKVFDSLIDILMERVNIMVDLAGDVRGDLHGPH